MNEALLEKLEELEEAVRFRYSVMYSEVPKEVSNFIFSAWKNIHDAIELLEKLDNNDKV